MELTSGVNWIAVIVGAVVAFLIGWLWYSPKLFGTKWAEGVGLDLTTITGVQAPAMITQVVGIFLLSWVVGITAAANSLLLCILIIVTIAVLIIANGYFAQKSAYARNTEAGYIIVMGIVMIAAQGIF
ncbi:DUF1761 family protein [Rhodobacteraceae bacterium KN286]|uniref:DUF1761 family protein n=1 Tax=Oceanomicrobium pacificus TaxID=2692916 RepID=A0A6B0TI88_9RHOB|nr:DUF1761 family protein [Oceanomicrobium pacificus]